MSATRSAVAGRSAGSGALPHSMRTALESVFAAHQGVIESADPDGTCTVGDGMNDLVGGLRVEHGASPDPGCVCIHNIIGTLLVRAVLVPRERAVHLDLTIKLSRTSAEESGGGKTLPLERGVFKDVVMAMRVQPALREICARTVAPVAVGMRHRESGRMLPGIRPSDGGTGPGIAPASTSSLHYRRAIDVGPRRRLGTRVGSCSEAGAVAAGHIYEMSQVRPVNTQLVPDPWLAAAYRAAVTGPGRVPLSPQDERDRQIGSADGGTLSLSLPAIHPTIAIDCGDAVNHQPEWVTACAMPSAHRAVHDGVLTPALTGLAAAIDDTQRDRLIGGVFRRHLASADPAGGAV